MVRVEQQLLEVFLAVRDVVGEARARPLHAEAGVEVRALEIAVDRDHAVSLTRERGRQVRDHEGLADAALAAAEGDHARAGPLRHRFALAASRKCPCPTPRFGRDPAAIRPSLGNAPALRWPASTMLKKGRHSL